MKIIERIVDLETGETTDIEREMTAEEFSEYQKRQAEREAAAAEAADREAARSALLDKLGITADEVKLLLGGN